MKILMKKVGGGKKARMWNMAQFQTRRWHREQNQTPNATVNQPSRTNPPNGEALSQIPLPSPKPESATTACKIPAPQEGPDAPPPVVGCVSRNSLVITSAGRTRVGKIARLPHDLRETVNAMLRGGFRYRDIVAQLKDLGHPGISENNVSFWKHHGYMDWLARQHELEARATMVKSFEHCTRALDTDRIQQNAIAFAAEQFCQVMALYDHRNILSLLTERPELFPKFVESMATLTRCSSDLAKAFTANQKSDTVIRSEMKNSPLTQPLGEPISHEDLDEEQEDAPSETERDCDVTTNGSDPRPLADSGAKSSASTNNSKQFQPPTTNPGDTAASGDDTETKRDC